MVELTRPDSDPGRGLVAGRRGPALSAARERHPRRDHRARRPDGHGVGRRVAVRSTVRARRPRPRSSPDAGLPQRRARSRPEPRRPAGPDLRRRPGCLHPRAALPADGRPRRDSAALADRGLRPTRPEARRRATRRRRNLLGFKDGTANLPNRRRALDELVWVGAGDGEPAWAVGGAISSCGPSGCSSSAGTGPRSASRRRSSGGRSGPALRSAYAARRTFRTSPPTPTATPIPLDAHIRLANPRTPPTERNRILRRGYSFSRGFDAAGLLDQGLIFVCLPARHRGRLHDVQQRLDGEPLEEYIRPIGGGFFYTLPGVPGADDYLGRTLLEG